MDLRLPHLSLIALVGASGSGKSTFARKHFLPTEVISSDYCRALVADDENNRAATTEAFDILHYIAAKRLAAGRLTVIDATNVRRDDRFDWTSAEFAAWCRRVADTHGYAVTISPIGPEDPEVGPRTQMAVFSRLAAKTTA